MKLNFTDKPKEKKKIKECKSGEAFRWGDSWYTRIEIDDGKISNFGDFYDEHHVSDMNKAIDYTQAIPVLHLSAQSFCYVNGEIVADEWANLTATLCVK